MSYKSLALRWGISGHEQNKFVNRSVIEWSSSLELYLPYSTVSTGVSVHNAPQRPLIPLSSFIHHKHNIVFLQVPLCFVPLGPFLKLCLPLWPTLVRKILSMSPASTAIQDKTKTPGGGRTTLLFKVSICMIGERATGECSGTRIGCLSSSKRQDSFIRPPTRITPSWSRKGSRQ